MKIHDLKSDVLKIIDKLDELEQKIINLDAKYKFKVNEIMLMLEEKNGNNELDCSPSK